MTIYILLSIAWFVGAGSYLAVSVLSVPDFVPSRLIKIDWVKAVLWPAVLVWVALTAMWHSVPAFKWTGKEKQKLMNLHDIKD